MKRAVRSVDKLLAIVGLEPQTVDLPEVARDFPVFVPLPYVDRIQRRSADDPLLRQVLPVAAEGISPQRFSTDPLGEQAATLQNGLLQKYQKRVLVIAGSACAINCRYCFRRHFPYETAAHGDQRWEETIAAIESDSSVNEVILSGGDPLTVADEKLSEIFERLAAIEHVQRVRIHTRLPVVIPQRVTDALLETLWHFRKSRLGRQLVFVVHANHANELDDHVCHSLRLIGESASQVFNQSVLLSGVNDQADILVQLSEKLLTANVMPYYLHQLDPITGTSHFEVPIEQGLRLIESMRARLPGYAVPRYVREIAGEPSKTVLA